MKYIVVECHLSYTVVLDEQGRFLKVTNMSYEVGQTVTDVVEIKSVQGKNTSCRWMHVIAAAAACMLLVATALLNMNRGPYGSVYLTINPEVRIDVNKNNSVKYVEGLNEDGIQLLDGYSYNGKQLFTVMDELLARAIDLGYISSGKEIKLALDAKSKKWVTSTGSELNTHIIEYLKDKDSVIIKLEEMSSSSRGTSNATEQQTSLRGYNVNNYSSDNSRPSTVATRERSNVSTSRKTTTTSRANTLITKKQITTTVLRKNTDYDDNNSDYIKSNTDYNNSNYNISSKKPDSASNYHDRESNSNYDD